MKKLTITLIVLSLFVFGRLVQAQWIIARGESLPNVRLSINLETNVLNLSSNYSLAVEVENSSTNIVYVSDDETTFLTLSNTNGDVYESPMLLRSDFDNRAHKAFDTIQPGAVYKWPLTFKIDGEIQGKIVVSGDYMLKAVRNIFSSDGKSHKLISAPISIQIK
jgi:hypothetical protein